MSITEFSDLDPTEFHLVPEGATGFPVLLAKAVQGAIDDEAAKARLDAKERHALPDSDFALPEKREYPIQDENHARAALSMLHNASPKDQKRIKAAVHRRYPDIGKDDMEKQLAPDKSVPKGEALSQTREVDEGPGPKGDPRPDDRGAPRHLDFPHPAAGDGQGDTAPDKTVPKDEALGQTRALGKAGGEADLTGDKAPDGDAEAAHAKDEAEGQSRKVDKPKKVKKAKKHVSAKNPHSGGAADSKPGSPEWEDKDVALGEKAEALVAQLAEVVHTFTAREKAEGDGKATKAGRRLSGKTEGAIRRCMQALQDLLDNNHEPSVSKEIEDMEANELIKLLDERDEARRAQQAKDEKKAAKKAAKAAHKGDKGDKAAKGANASKAAEGAENADELRKTIAELAGRLEKVESEPGTRPFVNGAGVAAALRGPERENALKAFDDRVAEAEANLAKAKEAGDTWAVSAARNALRMALHQRTGVKMIAAENAREVDPQMTTRALRGQGVPLLTNRNALPDDVALRAF